MQDKSFNLYREQLNNESAIRYIAEEKARLSADNKYFHILGLQPAFAYITQFDFDNAEKILSQTNYRYLRTQDRHSYNYIKGIVLFHSGDYTQAMRKFDSSEKFFLQEQYFYDVAYMNALRYLVTLDKYYLVDVIPNDELKITKNVFLSSTFKY